MATLVKGKVELIADPRLTSLLSLESTYHANVERNTLFSQGPPCQ